MNQELKDYLLTLISPPAPHPRAVVIDLALTDLKCYDDATLTGIITQGTPTSEQSADLLRILRPGAHLLVMAPETEPTGHTGACNIEDAGFEIRDAILLVDKPERFHYVPKAARAEREAGLAHLQGKTTEETVGRQEGSAGTQNPRAGAGRGANAPRFRCALCDLHLGGGRASTPCPRTEDGEHDPIEVGRGPTVRNVHPTVKPVEIMERLLFDVDPEPGPVLDPFMGSGTTGLACVNTGHDFVGIEREASYLEICDGRVRHWDMNAGFTDRQIFSDYKPVAEAPQEGFDFDDL